MGALVIWSRVDWLFLVCPISFLKILQWLLADGLAVRSLEISTFSMLESEVSANTTPRKMFREFPEVSETHFGSD